MERREVFVALFAAALLLLPIAFSPALASGAKPPRDTLLPPALRDSFPNAVSYPMTHVTKVTDSALVARMTALLLIQDKVTAESRTSYGWWMSGSQPFVESLLPGSRWLLEERHENPVEITSFGEYSPQLEFLILYKDRFYRLNELNALWHDADLSLDSAHTRAMAVFSILVAGFTATADVHWTDAHMMTELQTDRAFPPVTILGPMTVETKRGGRFLLVECIVDRGRGTARVAFNDPGGLDSLLMWSSVTGLGLNLSASWAPDPFQWTGDGDIPIVDGWRLESKPQLVSVPTPDYPEIVRKAGIEGKMAIRVLVDTNGTVAVARAVKSSGNSLLDASALDAARRARFTPPKLRGVGVRTWTDIPFQFTLPKK